MPPRRWPRALALAAWLATALPVGVQAQTGAGAQSVEELKAALADLRRRLEEQQSGKLAEAANARLKVAQQQLQGLLDAMTVLRRERDSLRAELGAVRTQLAARERADAEAGRRLRDAEAELADLRRRLAEAERAAPAPALALPLALAAPEPAPPEIVTEVLDGAYFVSGGAEVTPEAGDRLAAIAELIHARPGAVVRITGYSDASGDAARNEILSLARAESVRGRLAALLAIDPATLAVEGRGEAEPVADNATPDGRRANRRVVVSIGP